jgi:uncharacterized protein (DUF58 family)
VTAPGQAIRARIGRHALEWARRRQGPDPRSVCLESGRIYILPTRAGLIFALIVLTMLLGAMNYSNNMGFALAFLLSGVGVISIYHCHRNLAGLHVHYLGATAVFAGQRMSFRFALENSGAGARSQLHIDWPDGHEICDEIDTSSRQVLDLAVATKRRGIIRGPRLKLSTRYPLGLLRAWAWIDMNLSELVYPDPAPTAAANLSGDPGHTTAATESRGDDDFSGLREYRPGDPPKHIAWKALARTGQKLVKEYAGGTQQPIWIDWADCPETDTEKRISWLTRRVLDSDAASRIYGLRLPGIVVRPARGPGHRHECLRHLALHGAHR